MILALCSFVAAFVLALLLVPVLSKTVAAPMGLLDLPDNNRKLHKRAIPLVGGIAVFAAISLTALVMYCLGNSEFGTGQIVLKPGDAKQFIGLLLGGGFLLLVGIVDDSHGLRGRQKLLGQIISISILVYFGFNFDRMSIGQTSIYFGTFSIAIVFLWCLAVTNSINLLDGADGFAATIGIVMSLAMAAMAMLHPQGRFFDALIVLALAGALAGFLVYNFPPAKVFLGDAGSMLIGFILAAISIRCMLKQATSYAFFAPVALLAIPFLDTGAAIIRRKLTGRSIYAVDRGHLHHSLAKRGFGPKTSLLWVGILCSTTAAGGVFAFIYEQSEYALVSIAIVMFVMIFGRLFGVAEFQLVYNKAKAIGKSLVRKTNGLNENEIHQSTVQLQGNRNWAEIWNELCEFAEDHELNKITFDINLPWIHESFHASRRRTDTSPSENEEWYTQVPLIVDGKIFGRVELVASKHCRFSHHDIISNLMKLTADIEPVLRKTAELPVAFETASIETGSIETEANGMADQPNDASKSKSSAATG